MTFLSFLSSFVFMHTCAVSECCRLLVCFSQYCLNAELRKLSTSARAVASRLGENVFTNLCNRRHLLPSAAFSHPTPPQITYNKPGFAIAKRALDLVTVVVPPALPAAMSVGLVYSLRRLKANRVFCIAPNTINACGGIDVVAFDKTGTLTEEGLDLRKVLYKAEDVPELEEESNPKLLDSASALVSCMAAAHSLAYINGDVCGDPIDLKMFEAIGWKLEEPHVGPSDRERDTVQQMVPRVVTFQPTHETMQVRRETAN